MKPFTAVKVCKKRIKKPSRRMADHFMLTLINNERTGRVNRFCAKRNCFPKEAAKSLQHKYERSGVAYFMPFNCSFMERDP
jgi:hypothetical protein